MAKTCKLLLLGLIPLAAGYALNYILLLPLPLNSFLMAILEAVLLFLWGYLAYRVSSPEQKPLWQAFLLCAVGLVMLGLGLYQVPGQGAYWPNFLGIACQMYFLPFLTLTATLLAPLFQLVMPVLEIWPHYIAIWIAMFLVSCIGCVLRRRRG